MAIVKAFRGIRPVKELASKIAALPYDVMSSDEAREMVVGNQHSFLHVDRPEIDLDPEIDVHDPKVYAKAKENLDRMIRDGEFVQDEEPCLYIYRQIMNGRSQTGIVFCASIDDYMNNIIKKHEFTRADKEQDRINHVDYCDANTGPIFLTYKEDQIASEIIDAWIQNESKRKPIYNFVAEDGITHIVWVVDNEIIIDEIVDLFKEIDYLYIADGHHRSASAVKVGLKRRAENPNYTGEEEFNYFLAVAFPDNDLMVMDYNRVVKDLNGMTKEELITKLEENFIVTKSENNVPVKPAKKHTFGMDVEGEWYLLEAKDGTFDENNPIAQLDVAILQSNVLTPILGIEDVRTSDRIDFIGGIRGIKELEKRVNSDMKIAFSMYPTEVHDIMDVADIGEVMPPKSTWFEPKLRSGLFIHELK
ncbi:MULTISPECIES: DUF1015 domain-containing protein [Clostridium]|jgi:Uncharacterized conserved protein|uniref:DUF1015 domain-containing protein n=3 Tax=Clostridium TaxID=1485 RepID=A0AAE2RMU1_CLOBE|nr:MULTISPECIES: DUF1015 family protein [Clostridium]ABR37032.1 uncharacterised conserved protein UCP033563 [Clostridium beijerinckii NCIMB 8052]AIU04002.1 hypothetical protein Cbs_4926 [Clostridium beijerinckii ATCC 35702]ALB43943.1 DUF1015 domain-containing protein [Clostridium beijerinckii NRRL B-598]AVK48844.1 hypothetical protein AXY43_12875 [Clostridium sp. MF28]MBC2458219.1 DUF1015 domain-containing protein [Clostridium beijerinckii]